MQSALPMSSPIRALVTAFVVVCVTSSFAQANTITLDSNGVVGAVEGKLIAANPGNEELLAERLLAMPINTIEVASPTPSLECVVTLAPCDYMTGDNNYAAANLTYINKDESQSPNILQSLQGDVYILAKYDGQNAGYILFYLPDWNADPVNTDNVIPTSGENIFGKHAISHYSAFRAERTVPDGGTTVALLGGVLLGLGALRRKWNV
jgi:hypothetical protein